MKICHYNQNIGTCIVQLIISIIAIPTGSTTSVQNVSTFQSVEANISDAHRIVLTEKPILTSLPNAATKAEIETATSISGNYSPSKKRNNPSDEFRHTTASISKGISQGIIFLIFLDYYFQ